MTDNEFPIVPASPLPERNARSRKYPFDKLTEGMAFYVTLEQCNHSFRNVRNSAIHYTRKTGIKLSCRKMPDGRLQVMRPSIVGNQSPVEASVIDPEPFYAWLDTFDVGESRPLDLHTLPSGVDINLIQDWIKTYMEREAVTLIVSGNVPVLSITYVS